MARSGGAGARLVPGPSRGVALGLVSPGLVRPGSRRAGLAGGRRGWAVPRCLVTAAGGRAAERRPSPPLPAPRWSPGVGFVPGPGRRACPRGALLFGGNKHNDRKENLSLQAWENKPSGFGQYPEGIQRRQPPPPKKKALLPTLCLSKFCLLIKRFFFKCSWFCACWCLRMFRRRL